MEEGRDQARASDRLSDAEHLAPLVETAVVTDRPAASRWLIFAIVSLALFMTSIDATVVATALPTLRHALHAPIEWTSWTITAYQLGLAVSMPIAGRLSDQLGRKRIFIAAAALFTAASLLCGLSDDIAMLIVLRLVQALGGGAFVPAATGVVVEVFGGHRTRALGMLSGIFPLGALAGPVIGGILLSDFSWRSIFFVNVPIGIVFTGLAIRYLPRSKPVGGRADVVGTAQVAGCLLAAMYAVTRLANPRVAIFSAGFLLPALASIAFAWALLRRSHRIEAPLIPLHLLRGRSFLLMNGANFVWGACAIGFGALIPLYAEERYGFTPLAAGTLLTARAVGEALLAVTVSMMIRRTGYRLPMIVGFWLISAGMILLVVPPVGLGPYGWLSAGAALTGLGIGASAPSANNASLELAPDDIGAISGLRGMFRQSGAILGVALTTSLVARSAGGTGALGDSFLAIGACLAAVTPLIALLPDHARVRSRRS